jgi:methionyl-tRNA formyltransferase
VSASDSSAQTKTGRRIVFAGTPEFSVACLDAALASAWEVVAVYTQPDRPSGRGRQRLPSPVKQRALAAGIAVFQPESLRSPLARRELESLEPDLIVVVAYGLLLTTQILAAPRIGCWNVHASILPRWRGAAPIQRALLAGDRETGVDLMQMEKGLDTGPVLLSRRTPIGADDTGASLHDRLSRLGAELLAEGLDRLAADTLPPAQAQSDAGITYASKIEKSEAVLDFNESCQVLERKVRAFTPWPIAETMLLGERIRVHSAQAIVCKTVSARGAIVHADRSGIDLACSDGVLRVTRIQRDGGKPISAAEYMNARGELKHFS